MDSILTNNPLDAESVDLEPVYKLFNHTNENVASWAISSIGTKIMNINFNDEVAYSDKSKLLTTQDQVAFYRRVLSILTDQSKKIDKEKSRYIIEGALWNLGNMASKQKIEKIPEEALLFINSDVFKMFPDNEETARKIILFACRFVSGLTLSNQPSRIALDSATLKKFISLMDIEDQMIVIWVVNFLGTLSGNHMSYNEAIRKEITTTSDVVLKKLAILLSSEDPRIVETTLWSLNKIADKDNIDFIKEIISTRSLVKFLDHTNDGVKETACFCIGKLASESEFIEGKEKLVKLFSNPNSKVRRGAIICFNMVVARFAETANDSFRLAISEDNVINALTKLLSDTDLGVVERACFLLGRLAELDINNIKKIAPSALNEIISLLDSSHPIYVRQEMAERTMQAVVFCFSNLVITSDSFHPKMIEKSLHPMTLLVSLLDENSPEVYKYSNTVLSYALWGISRWAERYPAFITNVALSKITSLSMNPDETIASYASSLLRQLAPLANNMMYMAN